MPMGEDQVAPISGADHSQICVQSIPAARLLHTHPTSQIEGVAVAWPVQAAEAAVRSPSHSNWATSEVDRTRDARNQSIRTSNLDPEVPSLFHLPSLLMVTYMLNLETHYLRWHNSCHVTPVSRTHDLEIVVFVESVVGKGYFTN